MFVQNFIIPDAVAPQKSLMKNFKEKEKWTNTRNDKHDDSDSLLHDTSSCTQCLYQISKS